MAHSMARSQRQATIGDYGHFYQNLVWFFNLPLMRIFIFTFRFEFEIIILHINL
jgi:hypothetical protein